MVMVTVLTNVTSLHTKDFVVRECNQTFSTAMFAWCNYTMKCCLLLIQYCRLLEEFLLCFHEAQTGVSNICPKVLDLKTNPCLTLGAVALPSFVATLIMELLVLLT